MLIFILLNDNNNTCLTFINWTLFWGKSVSKSCLKIVALKKFISKIKFCWRSEEEEEKKNWFPQVADRMLVYPRHGIFISCLH